MKKVYLINEWIQTVKNNTELLWVFWIFVKTLLCSIAADEIKGSVYTKSGINQYHKEENVLYIVSLKQRLALIII